LFLAELIMKIPASSINFAEQQKSRIHMQYIHGAQPCKAKQVLILTCPGSRIKNELISAQKLDEKGVVDVNHEWRVLTPPG